MADRAEASPILDESCDYLAPLYSRHKYDGTITNNWSGTTTRYWRETRRVDFDAYRQVR